MLAGEEMSQSVRMTLMERGLTGLSFIYRHRFLTIAQFARAAGLHYISAANKLRQFERSGLSGISAIPDWQATARPPTHVQGVRLNHAIFASEEVICFRLGVQDG